MKLVAYVDESGSDSDPNSEVFVLGGWVALRDEWAQFCKDWQRVLNKYSARYFHFREWSEASAVVRKKRSPSSKFGNNPYKLWDQDRLDSFLFELAEVAASGDRLVVGGYVPPHKLRADQASGEVTTKATAEELCVSHFFNSVISTVSQQRRVLKRQGIAFFFDHSTKKEWKKVVSEEFELSCKKHRQFKEIAFVAKGLKDRVDNGDVEYLPLQAADMVAYRLRQRMEKLVNLDFSGPEWQKLDSILFASMNKRYSKLTDAEKDAVLRRVFVVPESMTYEQAMRSITATDPIRGI